MPPRYYTSSNAVSIVLRDATPPPLPEPPKETSGVVILLAVLGSVLFAILFFWGVKRRYWEGWWVTGYYYPIPAEVQVVWLPNDREDYCSTCSGESHITIPSTDSPSSSSSLSIKPGASAGTVRLITEEVQTCMGVDDTKKRDMITPNDAMNNELAIEGGIPFKKGDGGQACAKTCVDLNQLDSGPSTSTVMSQCGTETRDTDIKVEGYEAVQEQESRSCILM